MISAQQVGHCAGIGIGVVDARDHGDLVADPAARRACVISGRGDDLGHRPAPVEWHQDVAQRVARGVEGDGERELRAKRGQPLHPGNHPGRRHGDVPGPEPKALRV